MKKLLFIALMILSLFILEALFLYIFAIVEGSILEGKLLLNKQDFRFVLGMTSVRTAFCFLPQLFIFYWGLNFVRDKVWGISLLNVATFVLLTVAILGIWTNDLAEYVRRPVFYYFVVATALSPLILGSFSLFRKLLDRI